MPYSIGPNPALVVGWERSSLTNRPWMPGILWRSGSERGSRFARARLTGVNEAW